MKNAIVCAKENILVTVYKQINLKNLYELCSKATHEQKFPAANKYFALLFWFLHLILESHCEQTAH